MKYYAKQINPAYQESPLVLFGLAEYDDIAVLGNRDYNEHLPACVARVRSVLEAGELSEALNDIAAGKDYYYSEYYKTATAAIMDLLPPEHKPRYSTREIRAIKSLVAEWLEADSREEREIIAQLLTIATGAEWETGDIRGCCQGDWQAVIYRSDRWNAAGLREFEAEYFNLGSEWIIHNEDDEPESPADICGYSLYITDYDAERGLREALSLDDGDELELYEFAGDYVTAIYKKTA